VRIKVARSARRHKVGNAHILAALANGGVPTVRSDGRLEWTAPDDRNVELHLVAKTAVEDPDLIIIFHAMPTALTKREDQA
jgi:hypothetical protein